MGADATAEHKEIHDLERYHLFHATRGEFLRALGRADEARAADAKALALTDNPAERTLLEQRIRSHEETVHGEDGEVEEGT